MFPCWPTGEGVKKKTYIFFLSKKKCILSTLKKNYLFNFLLDFTIRSRSSTILAAPAPVIFLERLRAPGFFLSRLQLLQLQGAKNNRLRLPSPGKGIKTSFLIVMTTLYILNNSNCS